MAIEKSEAGLESELAIAEHDLREAKGVELDVEAVVSFAENVLLDAARMWAEMGSEQKQRFQQVLFPEGVQYADGAYRTSATCLMFSGLQPEQVQEEQLVREWNRSQLWRTCWSWARPSSFDAVSRWAAIWG